MKNQYNRGQAQSVFKEYNLVRVVKLLRSIEEYDGWRVNRRSPQVGDIGAILNILHAPNLPDHYIVESVAPDGSTIWVSEFVADEIELVPKGTSPG